MLNTNRHLVSLVLLLLFLFLGSTLAEGYRGKPFPNPQSQDCSARHGPLKWVCDPDGILSTPAAKQIDATLEFLQSNVTADCGQPYQVAFALTNYVRPYSYSSDELREFAKDIHDEWGVGFQSCQSGVVFLLSKYDRKMYISTGRDAKEVITDHKVQYIISSLKDLLRANKFDAAVQLAADSILRCLQKDPTFMDESWSFGDYFFVGAILSCIGLYIFGARRRSVNQRNYRECQDQLKMLESERLRAEQLSEQYEIKHCPICLTDWEENSKTTLLRCGHKFCETCILDWLKNNNACPICRADTRTGEAQRPVDRQNRNNNNNNNNNNTSTPSSSSSSYPDTSRSVYDEDDCADGTSTSTSSRSSAYTSTYAAPRMTPGQFYLQHVLPFELLSLHRRYPSYVTPTMVNRWASPSYTQSFHADPDFIQVNPIRANPPSSSSFGGRSSGWQSFGGGSSGGGGGGGGGW